MASSPTTFHRFPDLPAEIRLYIWRQTLSSTDGLISLFDWGSVTINSHDPSLKNAFDCSVKRRRKLHVETPAAFFVNQESRGIAEDWAAKEGLAWWEPWFLQEPSCAGKKSVDAGDIESKTVVLDRPIRKALGRNYDQDRDYVYIGWQTKALFKENLQRDLRVRAKRGAQHGGDTAQESSGLAIAQSEPSTPTATELALSQIDYLVVPAFTGYYSTELMLDILRYRQLKKLYILWGKLPEPGYDRSVSPAGSKGLHELDVQPSWRLERIEMVEEGAEGDEVEMYSYIPKNPKREVRPGDAVDLYIEKGSLSEWMEELEEQLVDFARSDQDDCDASLLSLVESLEIVPVRLV